MCHTRHTLENSAIFYDTFIKTVAVKHTGIQGWWWLSVERGLLMKSKSPAAVGKSKICAILVGLCASHLVEGGKGTCLTKLMSLV